MQMFKISQTSLKIGNKGFEGHILSNANVTRGLKKSKKWCLFFKIHTACLKLLYNVTFSSKKKAASFWFPLLLEYIYFFNFELPKYLTLMLLMRG